MGDLLRYLVSIDSASGAVVKVERIGEAGDLAEVDPAAFVSSLASGPGGPGGATAPSPIVINIYAGGTQGGPARTGTSGQPIVSVSGWEAGPPPTTPPPNRPKRGRKK